MCLELGYICRPVIEANGKPQAAMQAANGKRHAVSWQAINGMRETASVEGKWKVVNDQLQTVLYVERGT